MYGGEGSCKMNETNKPGVLTGALVGLMLTLPVIAIMRRPRTWVGLSVALMYAVVMALPTLVPNEVLTTGLRIAHTAEVFVGNFLFGWAVVGIFARPAAKVQREARPERASRTLEASTD